MRYLTTAWSHASDMRTRMRRARRTQVELLVRMLKCLKLMSMDHAALDALHKAGAIRTLVRLPFLCRRHVRHRVLSPRPSVGVACGCAHCAPSALVAATSFGGSP